MRRTYLFGARAGLVALAVMLILLGLPMTATAQKAPRSVTLGPGAGYAGAEAAGVKALQWKLRKLGWRPGPVDGLYGPRTTAAAVGLQRSAGLEPDGIVGPRTAQAVQRALRSPLRRGVGYAQPNGSPRVHKLQTRLQRVGANPGPADGVFGPRTQAAVKRVRLAARVAPDGVVGGPTKRVLAKQGFTLDGKRAGTPSAPAAAKPDQPGGGERTLRIRRPAETEAERASNMSDSGDPNLALVISAALVFVLAALTATLLGRRGRVLGETSAPLAHGLFAEGGTGQSSIGRFRGPVHALVLKRRGLFRRQETRYLVSDPKQPSPFWVGEKEVAKLVTAPEAQGNGEAAPEEPARPPNDGVRALGYVSIREAEETNAARPHRQMEAIDSLCDERDWRLLEVVRDREEPQGSALDRPGLEYALQRVERGEASCLVVSDLVRLSRSVADLGRVLDVLGRDGGRLVAVDLGVDTSTPEGRKAAEVLVAVSGWERQRLAERTRRGLEAARARGAAGARRSVGDVPALNRWIVELRESGMTLQAIANRLNEEGVPTLRGGVKWRPSSVQAAAGYRRPPRRSRAVASGEHAAVASGEHANGGPANGGGG
jgi:DNA invertase Pin-like site-specific DNA recombinase/peptidoglycan hydrolase-like protein with peptidoglycan-binding domain